MYSLWDKKSELVTCGLYPHNQRKAISASPTYRVHQKTRFGLPSSLCKPSLRAHFDWEDSWNEDYAKRPVLLDLFSGAGGAAFGYYLAGFRIVGVDINPQPNFPFEFHQADALTYPLEGFDVIHASPPCQNYSRLKAINKKEYPDLIGSVRKRIGSHLYIIENVVGAPLRNPIRLCGSMFGLGVWRHRIFEIPYVLKQPICEHDKTPLPIDVTGTGGPCLVRTTAGGGIHRKPKNMKQASDVMGIDWMIRKEITQAIPPAYTEYIGNHLKLLRKAT